MLNMVNASDEVEEEDEEEGDVIESRASTPYNASLRKCSLPSEQGDGIDGTIVDEEFDRLISVSQQVLHESCMALAEVGDGTEEEYPDMTSIPNTEDMSEFSTITSCFEEESHVSDRGQIIRPKASNKDVASHPQPQSQQNPTSEPPRRPYYNGDMTNQPWSQRLYEREAACEQLSQQLAEAKKDLEVRLEREQELREQVRSLMEQVVRLTDEKEALHARIQEDTRTNAEQLRLKVKQAMDAFEKRKRDAMKLLTS